MICIKDLEERLQQTMPAVAWDCHPAPHSRFLANTDIPEHLEIKAVRHGIPLRDADWHLSGSMLLRWGLDATAHLICDEYARFVETHADRRLRGDKLAEI